jgi:putative acyl-CoA dehydrogenase
LLGEDFAQVKGQDRHFDRSWRQLQQKLRKPQEAQGREITQQLFLLGAGSQMLRHHRRRSQAWCRMMLDTRGGSLLSEQVQNDLLLRATGRVG